MSKILNNIIKDNVCKYLNVEHIEFMDDVYNKGNKNKTIHWIDRVRVGGLFTGHYEDRKREKEIFAKQCIFRKDGKTYGVLLRPIISGRELNHKEMVEQLKNKIDKAINQQGQ